MCYETGERRPDMTIGAVGGYSAYTYYQPAVSAGAATRMQGAMGMPSDMRMPEGDRVSPSKQASNPDEIKKPGRKSSPEECQTCKDRTYQDGSDEANVSFKNPAHVSPEAAGAAVRAHEGQHVSNAYKKAAEAENAKVVSANVTIHTAICPECGRTYVSGGTTRTAIKYSNESNPYQQNRKAAEAAALRGANVDFAV